MGKEDSMEDAATTEVVEEMTDEASPITEETVEVVDEESVDLSDVPEDIRENVKKYASKYEKDFKRAYTKKTQALAEEKKRRDQDVDSLRNQLSQYENIAREIAADPSKVNVYLKQYQTQETQTGTPPPPSEGVTIEEYNKYWEKRLEDQAKSLRQELVQQREQDKIEARWASARTSKREDPKFAEWEDEIMRIVSSDQDVRSTYTGSNEKSVLNLAYEKVKVKLRKGMEDVKKSVHESMEKKKKASTATPKKSTQTTSEPAVSKDDIIARVNAKVGG